VGSKQKKEMSFTRDQVPQSVLAIWPRVLACDEEERKSKIGVKEEGELHDPVNHPGAEKGHANRLFRAD
jgi:hypothetical protein